MFSSLIHRQLHLYYKPGDASVLQISCKHVVLGDQLLWEQEAVDRWCTEEDAKNHEDSANGERRGLWGAFHRALEECAHGRATHSPQQTGRVRNHRRAIPRQGQ